MRACRARQPGADPGSRDMINTLSLLLDRHPKEREGKRDPNRLGVTCHVERKLFPRDCKVASVPSAWPSKATSQNVLTFAVIRARKNMWICY